MRHLSRRTFLKYGAASVSWPLYHSALASTTESRWVSGPELPVAIQEIYPAVHGERLYVAGGIGRNESGFFFSRDCVSIGAGDAAWRAEANLPDGRHHGQLASVDGKLLLIGGFSGDAQATWRMVDAVHELTDKGWRRRAVLPQARAEGVAGVGPDGRLHLATGQSPLGRKNARRTDHGEVRDHWVHDPKEDRWRDAAPIPTPRNSACGGWLGDAFVVAGGRTAKGNLDVTEVYDAGEDRWRSAAPLPKPQAGTAAAVIDGSLLVFGGEIFQPEANVFPDVWRYRIDDDAWTPEPPLPTPRHGLGAGVLGDAVYVVGGATAPGGRGTSTSVEILRPPQAMQRHDSNDATG